MSARVGRARRREQTFVGCHGRRGERGVVEVMVVVGMREECGEGLDGRRSWPDAFPQRSERRTGERDRPTRTGTEAYSLFWRAIRWGSDVPSLSRPAPNLIPPPMSRFGNARRSLLRLGSTPDMQWRFDMIAILILRSDYLIMQNDFTGGNVS